MGVKPLIHEVIFFTNIPTVRTYLKQRPPHTLDTATLVKSTLPITFIGLYSWLILLHFIVHCLICLMPMQTFPWNFVRSVLYTYLVSQLHLTFQTFPPRCSCKIFATFLTGTEVDSERYLVWLMPFSFETWDGEESSYRLYCI